MKVLFATMQFGRGYCQGTERYLSILCDGLREHGHEPLVLAGDPDGRGDATALGQVVQERPLVLNLPARGWMAVEGTPPSELVPLLREHSPDVVHVANPAHVGLGLIAAAREVGIPIAITVMDYWWLCPKQTLHHTQRGVCDANVGWRECLACIAADRPDSVRKAIAATPGLRSVMLPTLFFRRWRSRGASVDEIERWKDRQAWIRSAMNRADAVVFASKTAREMIAPRLDGPCVYTVPYGLEAHWFAGVSRTPRTLFTHAKQPTIGYAGALAPHKGVHLFLEAVRSLGCKEAPVRIAGRGEDTYVQKLHGLADGLNVEFVGAIPPAEMPAFLDSLDVLIVPSMWPENLPIIVLEAHARGVPVLASRVGGIAEFIRDASRLFTPGSASELAICLSNWANQPDSGEQTATVSTAEQMVASTLAIYADLRRKPAASK